MRKKDIDKLDLEILKLLQRDASITNKKLSEKINLSQPPTLARVNALRKKGVILNYKIKVNYEYLRYQVSKTMIVKFKTEDVSKSYRFWVDIPWINGLTISTPDTITSIHTLVANFRAPGEEDFQESLEVIKTFEGLIDIQVLDAEISDDVSNTL